MGARMSQVDFESLIQNGFGLFQLVYAFIGHRQVVQRLQVLRINRDRFLLISNRSGKIFFRIVYHVNIIIRLCISRI